MEGRRRRRKVYDGDEGERGWRRKCIIKEEEIIVKGVKEWMEKKRKKKAIKKREGGR